MRALTVIVLLMSSLTLPGFGQHQLQLMKISSDDIGEINQSRGFETESIRYTSTLVLDRFNLMGYKPVKYDGYQVISSNQPNSHFDIVYLVDKEGNTVRRFYTTTAAMNFDPNNPVPYDSMNPYGSESMASAVINGLLGTILNRGFGIR